MRILLFILATGFLLWIVPVHGGENRGNSASVSFSSSLVAERTFHIRLSHTLFPCAASIPLIHHGKWGYRHLGYSLLLYGSVAGPSTGDFVKGNYTHLVSDLKIQYSGFAVWFAGTVMKRMTFIRHLGSQRSYKQNFGYSAGRFLQYAGIGVYIFGVSYRLINAYSVDDVSKKETILLFPYYRFTRHGYEIQLLASF